MLTAKTQKIIVTGGSAYVDIDLLACAQAYAEALNLFGISAEAVLTPPYNQTIPPNVRNWQTSILHSPPQMKEGLFFALMDVSDPNYFEKFVSLSDVIEVYDHHFGHETYWKNRLKDKAHIEHVGACATLIWEKIVQNGLQSKMSKVSVNLLYTAIFANTLDFKAFVTTERDLNAAQELEKWIDLPIDWKAQYYAFTEKSISSDLKKSILTDTKTVSLSGRSLSLAQLELWDGQSLLHRQSDLLHAMLQEKTEQGETFLLNLVSISEGRNYLLSNTPTLLKKFSPLIGSQELTPFLLTTNRLWLRKELLRLSMQNKL